MGDVEVIKIESPFLQLHLAGEDLVEAFLLPEFHGNLQVGLAVFLLNEADDLGGLDGGGNVNIELATFAGGESSKGVLVGKQFAVVKNPHKYLLKM